MKYLIIILFVFISLSFACKRKNISKSTPATNPMSACDTFYFNLTDGTINGVAPTLSDEDIREWLPCYTSFTRYGADSNCAGAIFYKKYGIYYYTANDFVEVRSDYKGRVYPSLMGKSPDEVKYMLGNAPVTNPNIDSLKSNLFTTKYGCLQVDYTNNKATSISAHYNECETLEKCR